MKIQPPPVACINGTWQQLDVSRYSFKEDVLGQKGRQEIRAKDLRRLAKARDTRKPR